MRFVHAADLHLDSPLRGLDGAPPAVAAPLREASFRTLDRIAQVVLDSGAACLLLAGDTYDSAQRSLRAQLYLRRTLERLSQNGRETLLVLGNHDPLDGFRLHLDPPPGVTVFPAHTPGGHDVVVEGRRVAHVDGLSFPTREVWENLSRRLRRKDDAPASIALLHASVGNPEGHVPYAPAHLEDLVGSGHDYWALGHIHRRQVLRAHSPAVVYPGNPQGRSMREEGERGVYLVDLRPPAVELTFVPVDQVRWERLNISSLDAQTPGELADRLSHELDTYARRHGRPAVVRLVLQGPRTAAVENLLGEPSSMREVVAQLRRERVAAVEVGDPPVWVEGLEDATQEEAEGSAQAWPEGTLVGDVAALAAHLAQDSPTSHAAREALRRELAPVLAQVRRAWREAERLQGDEELASLAQVAARRLVRALGGPEA